MGTLTGLERVQRALRHMPADRVPVYFSAMDHASALMDYLNVNQGAGLKSYEDLLKYLQIDIRAFEPVYCGPAVKTRSGGTSTHNLMNPDYGGKTYSRDAIHLPFEDVEDISSIDRYPWPDPNWWDITPQLENMEACSGRYALMFGYAWNPILCQLFEMFGMEKTMINMHLEPALIEAALARLEAFYMAYYSRFFKVLEGRVQIFAMGDDFASQSGMMISPEHWRRFLKPVYRKIFALAKSHGFFVWLHACGAIREVLPDLVEIGLDVWETVQTHLPGNEPEVLKREFGRDITFFGGISTQTTLPFGSTDDVRREVRERIAVLGENGGYICGPDHRLKEDVPVENIGALFDEARRYQRTQIIGGRL